MQTQLKQMQYWLKKLLLIIILAVGIIACSTDNTWYFKESGSLLWIDSNHSDEAIKSAVFQTLENSSIIVVQTPWSPNDNSFYHNTNWYYHLAKDHGKTFMISIDWQEVDRSGTNGEWSFTDSLVRRIFIKNMIDLINDYKPDFINLGVEVNYYALKSPAGFKSFVDVFNELKKSIKSLDPKIKVGLSYQLELLYGNHKDWQQVNTLKTLDVIYQNIDFLGLSTYPNISLVNTDLSFTNLNYIDSIAYKYKIPIGVSESGISGSLYTNDDRTRYVKEIFHKATQNDLKFLIWGSMINSPRNESWSYSIGLLDSQGNPKEEFSIWKSESLNYTR